jgi:hypothetical protein
VAALKYSSFTVPVTEMEQSGCSEIFIIDGIPVMEKEQSGRSEIFIIYFHGKKEPVLFTVNGTSYPQSTYIYIKSTTVYVPSLELGLSPTPLPTHHLQTTS